MKNTSDLVCKLCVPNKEKKTTHTLSHLTETFCIYYLFLLTVMHKPHAWENSVFRHSHPAISNRVITITNSNSLWNSCPLFCTIQSIRVNVTVHWTVPFSLLLFLICFPCQASTDLIIPQVQCSVLLFMKKNVLIMVSEKQRRRSCDSGRAFTCSLCSLWMNQLSDESLTMFKYGIRCV